MAIAYQQLVDPKVWEDLQSKIDDDNQIREQIRDIVQTLEKQVKLALSSMTNAHATGSGMIPSNATSRPRINSYAEASQIIQHDLFPPISATVKSLDQAASQHPYYKYSQMWARQMQDATFAFIFCCWCGGLGKKEGHLLTIDEVGSLLDVPVNVKDRDTFHLTIEEYLHALVSLIDELARLARNSVTQGDYRRPVLISQFVKDLHAGFQLLNLKNDSLRKRSDGIKYRVREVEDVVYDLSLRQLLPKD